MATPNREPQEHSRNILLVGIFILCSWGSLGFPVKSLYTRSLPHLGPSVPGMCKKASYTNTTHGSYALSKQQQASKQAFKQKYKDSVSTQVRSSMLAIFAVPKFESQGPNPETHMILHPYLPPKPQNPKP